MFKLKWTDCNAPTISLQTECLYLIISMMMMMMISLNICRAVMLCGWEVKAGMVCVWVGRTVIP